VSDVVHSESEVVEQIRGLVNEIDDPCSIAQGVPTGLVDMGLVNGIRVEATAEGHDRAVLDMRLTGPGCLYSVHFEREIGVRLEEQLGIEDVEIRWSPVYDWTQDDLAPHVKDQLRERRERLLAAAGRSETLPIVSAGAKTTSSS